MKKLKLNKLNILLVILGVISLLFILCLNKPVVYASGDDVNIYFDIAKGPISIEDSTYSGYDSEGNLLSGTHTKNNVYTVSQTNPTKATKNTISIFLETSNNLCRMYFDGVNIRTNVEETTALYAYPRKNTYIHLIFKDNSYNYFYSSSGHAGIEKCSNSVGLLLITCEQGYSAWLNDPLKGHVDEHSYSACTDQCGFIDAKSGNAWYSTSTVNTYFAAAGIGTSGNGTGGSKKESTRAGDNCLDNLTFAGGNIYATGGRGTNVKTSSGGGANIGVGAAATRSDTAGTITNFNIVGGKFNLWRSDNSAAMIGGGYRAGYANIKIYGGTIIATDDTETSGIHSTLTKTDDARAAGIGGGGGGRSASAGGTSRGSSGRR